jgi:molecular chaperone GrpE
MEVEEEEEETDDRAGELADWKARLRYDFERWLSTVDEVPESEDTGFEDDPPPDLYSFFEQLAVLNTESRRGNRRTAETLSQWGEALVRFEAELGRVRELATQSLAVGGGADRLSRTHCLALVEVLDRLHRLGAALARTPARAWFGRDRAWRKAWENQRQAFHIVSDHLEALLRKEGVTRLDTLGKPFDPLRMAAVAAEPTAEHPPQTVLEEIARGYLWGGEVLRVAQVKTAVPPPHP